MLAVAGRFVAGRFVAGETIADALAAVRTLNDDGFTATLDFLGEDVTSVAEAHRTRDVYLGLIDAIGSARVQTNVSVKLSAIGLVIDPEVASDSLHTILERAVGLPDPFVRIDMEGSALVDPTLAVFERAFASHRNVGPVLQASLRRTDRDVARTIELGARVRLCKGAYDEPASIAVRDKAGVRERYRRFAGELLTRGSYPAFATHDRELIDFVRRSAAEASIGTGRFEFQMLYGVRPALQKATRAAGHRVRIYVPFGTHWQRYLWRRVRERRENALFAARALLGH